MNDRIEKIKTHIKEYKIAYTCVGTTIALVGFAYLLPTKKSNDGWTGFVLNQDQRNEFARNADAVLVFPNEKVMILGQSWNQNR